MAHWLDPVETLLRSRSADLRELAVLVGGEPGTFYRGTDVSHLDLSQQDLSGMDFGNHSVEEALLSRVQRSDEMRGTIVKNIETMFVIEVESYSKFEEQPVTTAKLLRAGGVDISQMTIVSRSDEQFECEMHFGAILELELGFEKMASKTVLVRQGSNAKTRVRYAPNRPDDFKVEMIDLGEYVVSLDYLLQHHLLRSAPPIATSARPL